DLLYIIGSMRAEFRYVSLYLIGGQSMLVATNDPNAVPSAAHVARIDAAKGLAPLLALYGGSVASLLDSRVLDPRHTDALLSAIAGVPPSYWTSSDDNLYLEYSTPKGNVLDTARSIKANLEFIRDYSVLKHDRTGG
ncbi:MAG TPA: hypothetical protein VMK05_02935, partial [Burkholderiales bacterium]|nr:hypothetical protein [Burkholderiales bacterium]